MNHEVKKEKNYYFVQFIQLLLLLEDIWKGVAIGSSVVNVVVAIIAAAVIFKRKNYYKHC